jgi:hypothetical protein
VSRETGRIIPKKLLNNAQGPGGKGGEALKSVPEIPDA